MAEINLGELAALTLDKAIPKLNDNATNNIQLLKILKRFNRVKTYDGSPNIRELLTYQANGTYTRYAKAQSVNISPLPTADTAVFSPRSVMVSMSITGEEILDNSGASQIENLLTAKMIGMEVEYKNKFEIDLWSNGTADGGLQIGGMQALVADSPSSGIVGGINSALYSWWRNFSYDATTDGGAAATSANIQTYMTRAATLQMRSDDQFDFAIADNNYWQAYHGSLLSALIIKDKYDSGSMEIDFMGRPVIHAGGYNGACPANHMYFLVSRTLTLRVHNKRNFTQVGKEREPLNQDMMVKLVGWRGNMTINNRLVNVVLKD